MAVHRILLLCVLALAACSRGEPELMQAEQNDRSVGPDEFSVTVHDRLEEPASYAFLPAPTPGGNNLADIDPFEDVAAALGGRVSPASSPARASELLSYVSRFGFDPDIREVLAACRDKPFWRWVVVSLEEIFGEIEKLRKWGMVCDHEECEQLRRASNYKKHIECPRNFYLHHSQ